MGVTRVWAELPFGQQALALPGESYVYDQNGNRTLAGGDVYRTGPANRMLRAGSFEYTYDDEGNRTSRYDRATGELVEYVWDHRNRLTETIIYAPREVVRVHMDHVGQTHLDGQFRFAGTLVGNPETVSGPPLNGSGLAIKLNGNEYIDVGNQDELKIRDRDYSISVWFYIQPGYEGEQRHTVPHHASGDIQGTLPFRIGRSNYGANQPWRGYLDDFRV